MENKIWFVNPNDHHDNYGIMAEGDAKFIKRVDRIIARDCTCCWLNDPNYAEKKSWGLFTRGAAQAGPTGSFGMTRPWSSK